MMFGCPSDVLKAFIGKRTDMPKTFILPDDFYKEWVIQAAIEFPLYYFLFVQWWFFKWEKLQIVWTRNQIQRIRNILNLTLLWPTLQQYKDWWIDQSYINTWLPLQKEMPLKIPTWERKWEIAQLDDIINFIEFDWNHKAQIMWNEITKKWKNEFKVSWEDWDKLVSINFVWTQESFVRIENARSHIKPCILWITALTKCTSWFDTSWGTTSLILWWNWMPIAIDWSAWVKKHLSANGINPDHVIWHILTHIHEDHSSIIDMIINGKKSRLITTKTIYESFVDKVANIIWRDCQKIKNMIVFIEVKPWEKRHRYGIEFEFFNTVHPIPTIWFKASVWWKSIIFSWDTAWWSKLEELHKKWVITDTHYEFIKTLPTMKSDLTIMDAWAANIHPDPIELDTHFREREIDITNIVLSHLGKIPDKVVLPFNVVDPWRTWNILEKKEMNPFDVIQLVKAPIFWWLSKEWLNVVISQWDIINYMPWDNILIEGSKWKDFFLILSWTTSVLYWKDEITRLSAWDFFWEMSLLNNSVVSATIKAQSACAVLRIPWDYFKSVTEFAFLNWEQSNSLTDRFHNLHKFRPLLLRFATFSKLSPQKILELTQYVQKETFRKWDIIIKQWDNADKLYWLTKWSVDVIINTEDWKNKVASLHEWQIFWEIAILIWWKRTADIIASSDNVEVFSINTTDLDDFMKNTPMFFHNLIKLSEERTQLK